MSGSSPVWGISAAGAHFIQPEDGGNDVFAHYSNIAAQGFRELQEGQKVQFDITQGQRGPQAENIIPA
ncbi:cold shock domain-containing protein [Actinoallomurus sp. NPDC052308]|uniref:cold shock domain-containing protein n=1 Tax=Actinoallomurus sp. NPDC052308 TaxID=3155530 RepID=UPI003441227B